MPSKSVKIRNGSLLTASLALILTGCYNDPDITRKFPGEGPENHMARPSVGPGTVAGGSTAGPQPLKKADHGEPDSGAAHTPPLPAGNPGAQPAPQHDQHAAPAAKH